MWTRVLLPLSLFFLGSFPFPRSTPCSFSSSFLPGVRRLSPAAPAAASLPLRAPHLLPPSGGRRPADPRQCGAPGRGRGGGAWERRRRPAGRRCGGSRDEVSDFSFFVAKFIPRNFSSEFFYFGCKRIFTRAFLLFWMKFFLSNLFLF